MEAKVYKHDGTTAGSIALSEVVFGVPMNKGLVHRALIYQLANARQGNAHSKTRGERVGSTRKIYRQKGTGRARMGGNRSPVRRKGGVAFGPRNATNYTISMNRKERRLALFCLLADKFRNGKMFILDSFDLGDVKTKNVSNILKSIEAQGKNLVACSVEEDIMYKSASNIATAKSINIGYLNFKDLLKYDNLVVSKSGIERINNMSI